MGSHFKHGMRTQSLFLEDHTGETMVSKDIITQASVNSRIALSLKPPKSYFYTSEPKQVMPHKAHWKAQWAWGKVWGPLDKLTARAFKAGLLHPIRIWPPLPVNNSFKLQPTGHCARQAHFCWIAGIPGTGNCQSQAEWLAKVDGLLSCYTNDSFPVLWTQGRCPPLGWSQELLTCVNAEKERRQEFQGLRTLEFVFWYSCLF